MLLRVRPRGVAPPYSYSSVTQPREALFTRRMYLASVAAMLDAEKHFTAQGLELRDAIFHAGRRRLRPILMTALATMFGMLPLAWGDIYERLHSALSGHSRKGYGDLSSGLLRIECQPEIRTGSIANLQTPTHILQPDSSSLRIAGGNATILYRNSQLIVVQRHLHPNIARVRTWGDSMLDCVLNQRLH